MIASATEARLDLIRIALAMLSSGQDMAPHLVEYLNTTFREASSVLRNPTETSGVSADAVRLAVELRKAGDPTSYLDELSHPERLSQALARDLLEKVEQRFAHFG